LSGSFLFGHLALFRLVIWRFFAWLFGDYLFGCLAKFRLAKHDSALALFYIFHLAVLA